jgi:uncharacterized membrane protein
LGCSTCFFTTHIKALTEKQQAEEATIISTKLAKAKLASQSHTLTDSMRNALANTAAGKKEEDEEEEVVVGYQFSEKDRQALDLARPVS